MTSELEQLHSTLAAVKQLADLAAQHEERTKWRNIARPEQLPPPGRWSHWIFLGGRGSGKTRSAAEFHKEEVKAGRAKHAAIVAPTASDLRKVVVEGPKSGILATWASDECIPEYQPTNRQIVFPRYNSVALLYSAEEPERFRGPQHDFYWIDEAAACPYIDAVFDMLQMGLRLGDFPRGIITSTPKPIRFLRDLLKDPFTVVTRSTSYANRDNLPPAWYSQIIAKYEGTKLGKQELEGLILDDSPDALWRQDQIDSLRVTVTPTLKRVVVAVDPATSSEDDANETGIIVMGLGENGHGYVLADRSLRARPSGWAQAAIAAFHEFDADGIVAEKNQGGEMVQNTIEKEAEGESLPIRLVNASRGKVARAEPISLLAEQGKIHHAGTFRTLEDQLCAWQTGGEYLGVGSPDHADAMIWAGTELFLNRKSGYISFLPELDRVHEEQTSKPLVQWLYRWISVSLGPFSSVHWYAQDGKQVRIYRELVLEGATVEKVGSELARISEPDLDSGAILNIWLDSKHFDASLGHKSVARQLSEGIDRELGVFSSFLNEYDAYERRMPEELTRNYHLDQRRKQSTEHRLVVVAASDDHAAGWEHLRQLLRWKPLNDAPKLEWNQEYALSLKGRQNGDELYAKYCNETLIEKKVDPPGLIIHDSCPITIRALGALARDDKKTELPVLVGENGAVAQSVLAGMLGHRVNHTRPPMEAFVAERLNKVRARKEDRMDAMDVFQVEQKAKADWKAQQATPMVLHILPRRSRRLPF